MALSTYSFKKLTVSAIQWLPDASNTLDIINELFGYITIYDSTSGGPRIYVATAVGGDVCVYPGTWFVKDADNGLSTYKEEAFTNFFEAK